MLKEEMIYEDAIDVIDKHFRGELVSQMSLGVATIILQPVWTEIYKTRVQRESAKEADTWKQELKD